MALRAHVTHAEDRGRPELPLEGKIIVFPIRNVIPRIDARRILNGLELPGPVGRR